MLSDCPEVALASLQINILQHLQKLFIGYRLNVKIRHFLIACCLDLIGLIDRRTNYKDRYFFVYFKLSELIQNCQPSSTGILMSSRMTDGSVSGVSMIGRRFLNASSPSLKISMESQSFCKRICLEIR